MYNSLKEDIKQKLSKIHLDDEEQLEVIFSSAKKLLVEAPAGYGKTRTIVSKIAYLIAIGQIPNPKKILALTFSLNASYKIKKDVSQQIPEILELNNKQNIKIHDKIFVSNYHGFCRHVLRIYGYLIHNNFVNIDYFESIDDSKIEHSKINILPSNDVQFIAEFNQAIKDVNYNFVEDHFDKYNELITKFFIPNNFIPYNAIITLTIFLFHNYPNILNFYQKYFPIIIIDEFQDTNFLHGKLLKLLISTETKLILMGDALQRIYGFIGAIPDLLSFAQRRYNMHRVKLNQNYRFKNNPDMLLLDKNIRINAKNLSNPYIEERVNINFVLLEDQINEAKYVFETSRLLLDNNNFKVAILFRQKNNNTKIIIEEFEKNHIKYFYGLFTDEDQQYILFHKNCLSHFNELLWKYKKITKSLLDKLIVNIKKDYVNNTEPLITSLIQLLEVFCNRFNEESHTLNFEDKIHLIKETFEYNGLKQNMEYLDSSIIISTIHGAKGLEWDYVILPDMEQYSFPNSKGLCGKCLHRNTCNIRIDVKDEGKFLEELSVFYVAVTRAKKNIYFSASKTRINYNSLENPCNISCLLNLQGLSYTIC